MEPLIIDRPELIDEKFRRVITCDPNPYFQLAYSIPEFSHYKRRNSVGMETIFPQPNKNICACGCGKKLPKRRKRWASDQCRDFAFYITQIIIGDAQIIRTVMRELYSEQCFICGKSDNDFQIPENPTKSLQYEMATKIHLDHIIPVHQGGGSLWLDNYQFLCIDCHKKKSKEERKIAHK